MTGYKYTNRDRQRSITTRRRNARVRREQIAELGYNPSNPTINLADNLVVTKEVERRLSNKADESTPLSILEVSFILISSVFILITIIARPFSAWNLTFLIPSIICFTLLVISRLQRIKARTNQLALERKERLDETRQFYSSPEWQQIRSHVIQRDGRICSVCGKCIHNDIDVTVDHKYPRSKHPDLALDIDNLRVLCRRCNSRKGATDWIG